MPNAKPIPEHCHTLNCYLTVKNASEAIEWYKKAFNAQEACRMPGPDGRVMHAELRMGDSVLMLSEEYPDMGCKSPQTLGGSACTVMMYVENVDQVFDQAIKAGGKITMPVGDMFWGDRFGAFTDPYGHKWSIATHKEDLSPEEIKTRQEQFFKQAAGSCK